MKKIKAIKNGLFSRNSALFKQAVKAGVNILSHHDNPKKIIEGIVGKDVKKFVDDLAMFKGSLTKAGQLLSQYGEYYLSDEINAHLKSLQSSTHFLDFEQIQDQVSLQALQELTIEREPLAAASIGQVHRAKLENQNYILKIQYKGIEKAISGDMFFLKMLMKSLNIFPSGVDASDIFYEIESVLKKEMDYVREVTVMKKYSELLHDPFYKVPIINEIYSNSKTICMEYVEGRNLSDIDFSQYPKDQVNLVGEKIFELFMREIFELGFVQTDAHGGNYLITDSLDQLVLLDFGACLEFEEEVLVFYRKFLTTSYYGDKQGFMENISEFSKYSGHALAYDEDIMWNYILKASSPLRSQNYNWGETQLPDELVALSKDLIKSMKFKSLPHQFIFLDRKLLGVFSLLRYLKAEFNVEKVFLKFLN